MIIPILGLSLIFSNFMIVTKIFFFLFIAWYLYTIFDFYKSELKGKNDKTN
ncbi:hypothetical protein BPJM79_210006 [Bacillus pumilus]|uniref:Uncharacterized protein n=1 Tax=Bacillus pumilus TaxID=1408 RepID=A0AB34QWW0_BACPU|nr:hypothetical protein B4127_0854 [Bacillus pumilus]